MLPRLPLIAVLGTCSRLPPAANSKRPLPTVWLRLLPLTLAVLGNIFVSFWPQTLAIKKGQWLFNFFPLVFEWTGFRRVHLCGWFKRQGFGVVSSLKCQNLSMSSISERDKKQIKRSFYGGRRELKRRIDIRFIEKYLSLPLRWRYHFFQERAAQLVKCEQASFSR